MTGEEAITRCKTLAEKKQYAFDSEADIIALKMVITAAELRRSDSEPPEHNRQYYRRSDIEPALELADAYLSGFAAAANIPDADKPTFYMKLYEVISFIKRKLGMDN